jgi:hypothetical protein
MANIASDLNDRLYSQLALEQFVKTLAPLNVFSTSYSSDAAARGASVEVPLVANLTATNFADSYESDGGVLDAIRVNIDKHKLVTVRVSDTEFSKSSNADVQQFAYQQGRALAQAVIEDIFSSFVTTAGSAAQFSASVTGLTTLTLANVRTLRKAMSADKVPLEQRSLILDTDLYDGLLAQNNLSDASQFGARDAIVDARVPRVYGMNVFEMTSLPANGICFKGVAVHPNALAVAVRALPAQAPSEYLAATTVTDPETGLSIGYRRHYSPATGRHFVSFEAVYGYTRAITSAAKLALGA